MSHLAEQPLNFKFQWIDQNGNVSGIFRKKGSFDGEILQLDDTEIPAAVITQVEVRDTRMVFAILAENGGTSVLAINLSQKAAQNLKLEIDTSRSSVWAEIHKERLQKQGRGADYRDDECPECGATLVLTDMPQTPQLYCQFCNRLSTVDTVLEPPPAERDLRICDECGMFSKPRKFTVFYFVFLIAVYYVSQRSTWRCPACMRGDAWKMLFGNLLFVIGVPVAIVQLIRSYGGSVAGGPFKGLDAANLKARRGDLMGALEGYRTILDRVPHSAGVKYNLGRALLEQGETARAADTFQLALNDCANYAPAYHLLARCYEELGANDKLAALKVMWDEDIEDEPLPEEAEELEFDE